MVGEVARPELAPEGRNCFASVGYDAPGLVWSVFRDAVEEVCVVYGLIARNELFFSGVLNITEVAPGFQLECLFDSKSFKGLILLNLLQRCELQSSSRHCAARVLNFSNSVRKSIQLGNVLRRDDDTCFSINDSWWCCRFNQDGLELTREHGAFEGLQ